MEITGTLVMAADTVLLPVEQLSEDLRRQVQAAEGDYAVMRPNSRISARIIDGDAAKLLEEFRRPNTVVQAVIEYCSVTKSDPESILEAAFPMLERLVHARLLVPADSPNNRSIRPLLEVGSGFAGVEIIACHPWPLEDTDLYRVKILCIGETAALKLMRSGAGPEIDLMFQREAFVLEHLDAAVTPAVLATGVENDDHYLLLSWCDGSDLRAGTAARFRASADYPALLGLSLAILESYAHLHARDVIHSDVHPRNILVDGNNSIRIVDFGLSRIASVGNKFRYSQRGGIGYFFEPEYANPVRSGRRPPFSSMLGEQYSLAALLLFPHHRRKHYVDFSLERHEMLRQIAEDSPLSFDSRGLQPWPAVEEILVRALAKDPSARFASVASFADALRSIGQLPSPTISPEVTPVFHNTALETLAHILKRLDGEGPLLQSGLTLAPRTSITYGSAGVACGLHRIACAGQDPMVLSVADLWGERSAREVGFVDAWYCPDVEITLETVGQVSPYHTESGVHFVKNLIAHSMGDIVIQQRALEAFISASLKPCDNLDLTLGRAGTLLAASHLLTALGSESTVNLAALRDLGNGTMSAIWQKLDSYSPILECRQIRYSGIAHGWAGILYATLCWSRASGVSLPPNTRERLDQLAALAWHDGRTVIWNRLIGGNERDAAGPLVGGWCNGTAGQVHLWLTSPIPLSRTTDTWYLLIRLAGTPQKLIVGTVAYAAAYQAKPMLSSLSTSGSAKERGCTVRRSLPRKPRSLIES